MLLKLYTKWRKLVNWIKRVDRNDLEKAKEGVLDLIDKVEDTSKDIKDLVKDTNASKDHLKKHNDETAEKTKDMVTKLNEDKSNG